jgi:hypothetical protein
MSAPARGFDLNSSSSSGDEQEPVAAPRTALQRSAGDGLVTCKPLHMELSREASDSSESDSDSLRDCFGGSSAQHSLPSRVVPKAMPAPFVANAVEDVDAGCLVAAATPPAAPAGTTPLPPFGQGDCMSDASEFCAAELSPLLDLGGDVGGHHGEVNGAGGNATECCDDGASRHLQDEETVLEVADTKEAEPVIAVPSSQESEHAVNENPDVCLEDRLRGPAHSVRWVHGVRVVGPGAQTVRT